MTIAAIAQPPGRRMQQSNHSAPELGDHAAVRPLRWVGSSAGGTVQRVMQLGAVLLCSLFLLAGARAGTGPYLEQDGLVVIEMESAAPLPGSWVVGNAAGASNGQYIVWEGSQSLRNPGNGLFSFDVQIQNPGTYRFEWRNQVGQGNNATEHNDTWVKIEADAFYGEKGNGSIVCPKGFDPQQNDCNGEMPEGSGSDGWFKVYSSGALSWKWSTRTSDNDAHNIFARFDNPGVYTILISARSSSHQIDRLIMHSNYDGDPRNLSLAESPQGGSSTVSGTLRQWHKVTVTFDGPSSSETANPNPFLDYRLDVTFSKGGQSFTVPGYFAGNGNGGASGNKWRVHFSPPSTGTWSYQASFRAGNDVAVSESANPGSPTSFNGATGSFSVSNSNKAAPDFRSGDRGLIKNRGDLYLTTANGDPWIKAGPDIPENFLGYDGFDNTPNAGHSFSAHASDWNSGDPDFNGGQGRRIIGALNFIADRGANVIYFLPMNIGGDGKDTFPTIGENDKTRYDLSKLSQWEVVFGHAQARGIFLHFVLAETESGNENYHDNGNLGPQRKLYYRMLLALFGHHNGIQFNIGEENDYGATKHRQFAAFIKSIDPYDHPVTTHTKSGRYDQFYDPLLGNDDYDMTSFQGGNSRNSMFDLIKRWREDSVAAGVPWAISFDEPQKIENDKTDNNQGYPHGRRDKMWPVLMAGGAGFEWYVQQDGGGHSFDQGIDDFGLMDVALEWSGHAIEFFEQLPLLSMQPNRDLADSSNGGSTYVLFKPGDVYAVYNDRNGGPISLDLSGVSGSYEVRWFDPRNGGALQQGTVNSVTGGGMRNLGEAPNTRGNDWALIVRRFDGDGGSNVPPTTSISSPANNARFDAPASFEVQANASDSDGMIASVELFVDDESQGVENSAPYRWQLNDLGVGSYDLRTVARDDEGAIGSSPTINVDVVDPNGQMQITGLTLIDAANDVDLDDLDQGYSIGRDQAESFNIRADVSDGVESVRFVLRRGNQTVLTQLENLPVYAMAGNNNNDYNPWNPALGDYILEVTPYPQDGANGTPGQTFTLEFQVVDGLGGTEIIFTNSFEGGS